MNGHRVTEIVKKYTQHNMIQEHTDLPEYPDCRTRLLYTFLRKSEVSTDQSELFSIVTSLVQMGLDTHDLVDVSKKKLDENQSRSRQLKVLAGDYFSSRFYYLLSRKGHIDIIKHLSEAICEVNRLKINLYLMMKNLKVTAEDYIQQTVYIKSQLFLTFSRLMQGLSGEKWPDILQGFTKCEIILQEIDRMETMKHFRFSWAFWFILHTATKEEKKLMNADEEDTVKLRSIVIKYNVRSHLFGMLDTQVKLVFSKVEQLDSQKMIMELYQIGMPYMRYLSAPKVL